MGKIKPLGLHSETRPTDEKVETDPRKWRGEMDVVVHVPIGLVAATVGDWVAQLSKLPAEARIIGVNADSVTEECVLRVAHPEFRKPRIEAAN